MNIPLIALAIFTAVVVIASVMIQKAVKELEKEEAS